MESAVIHGGIYGDDLTGAVNTPIYLTSTLNLIVWESYVQNGNIHEQVIPLEGLWV